MLLLRPHPRARVQHQQHRVAPLDRRRHLRVDQGLHPPPRRFGRLPLPPLLLIALLLVPLLPVPIVLYQPPRVHHRHAQPAKAAPPLLPVPRRARQLRDDGRPSRPHSPHAPRQPVEERGLPHIGPPDQRQAERPVG